MEIYLPREVDEFIAQLVASGRFDSSEQVITVAIGLLRDQEDLHKMRLEELRKEIAIGLEQANRGEVAPLDVQAILARSRERLAQEATLKPPPALRR